MSVYELTNVYDCSSLGKFECRDYFTATRLYQMIAREDVDGDFDQAWIVNTFGYAMINAADEIKKDREHLDIEPDKFETEDQLRKNGELLVKLSDYRIRNYDTKRVFSLDGKLIKDIISNSDKTVMLRGNGRYVVEYNKAILDAFTEHSLCNLTDGRLKLKENDNQA